MLRSLTSEERNLTLQVLRLRYWQHLMNEDLKKKKFVIPIHVAIGHEALAAAVAHSMSSQDQLVLTHRNMAYNLARTADFGDVVAEYKLSPSGVASGRLGSMNLADPGRGVVYSSSVLGNNIPVACGLALAKQMKEDPGFIIALTGDGAMEEGPFYEGLVFSKTHRLRMIILVENNNMSMSSTIPQRRCEIDLKSLCGSVDIPFGALRGNDPFEYLSSLRAVRSHGLEQETPVCIEAHLGSINQHAGPTPGWPTDPKNISLERGLLVEETDRDPVFVLKQKLGEELFEELSQQVLSESWSPVS